MKKLRLILGDQLNLNHSWFQLKDNSILYVMMEIRQETDYVKHHIQKILSFFAAMRDFAHTLESQGHTVLYIKLSDRHNTHSLTENLKKLIKAYDIDVFEYLLPDEYRLDQQLNTFCQQLSILHDKFDTEHFLTNRNTLNHFFKGKKTFRMENFYRMMRRRYHILLEGEKPLGGKWNFDLENRKKYGHA